MIGGSLEKNQQGSQEQPLGTIYEVAAVHHDLQRGCLVHRLRVHGGSLSGSAAQ